MTEDFIVCRCENIYMSELQNIIEEGATNARELKLKSRAGMGFCTSRTCGPFIEKLTGDHSAEPTFINLKSQPPIRTVSFSELIEGGSE
ncbi:(2Fe-2S)-binding protein [Salinicoccus siamensis]|uniref:(2Fe-2S)-binding protein n=1 Tax=Salinicoccus siamensis TaxID=381830 RepID=A0ABV5Z609_9STAP